MLLKKQFIIELKSDISQKDLVIIRNFYLPILGSDSINLYFALLDQKKFFEKNFSFFDWNNLIKILKLINYNALENCRKKLEAIGLIRTFENNDKTSQIIVINKPLSIKNFKNNKLIYNLLISKIGINLFEKIYFSLEETKLKKDNYKEISIKYQNIFKNLDSKNNFYDFEKDLYKNISESPLIKLDKPQSFIDYLDSYKYFYHLTKQKPSPSQNALIKKLNLSSFSFSCINEIINYSFFINKKIINRHIEVIANDFIKKNIKSQNEIQKQLFLAKNNLQKKQIKIKNNIVKNNSNNQLEWNDILNSLGNL